MRKLISVLNIYGLSLILSYSCTVNNENGQPIEKSISELKHQDSSHNLVSNENSETTFSLNLDTIVNSNFDIENSKIDSIEMKYDIPNSYKDTIYSDSGYCIIIKGMIKQNTFEISEYWDLEHNIRSTSKISNSEIIFKDSMDHTGQLILTIHTNDTVLKKW